jgi:GNAT superfamily N-acetyltransferase
MNFRLRPAIAEDLPAIVAMRDRLNALELVGCPHASIQKLTLAQFVSLWGPTLSHGDYCWRVVEADAKVVGFGLIYLSQPRIDPPAASLHWAYLEPAYRRGGLGQRLVDELLAWARARRAGRVELQFIDGNVIAERFWSKMGFEPYARKCVRYFRD